MTYKEFDNWLGLTSLNAFFIQLMTEGSSQCENCVTFYKLHSDPSKAFRRWTEAAKYCKGTIFTRWSCEAMCYFYGLADAIKAVWNDIWEFLGARTKGWWDRIWSFIDRLREGLRRAFFDFAEDPWGFLKKAVVTPIEGLIRGVKTIIDVTYNFAKKLWDFFWGWLSPHIESLKRVIIGWIDRVRETIKIWIDRVINIIDRIWGFISDRIRWLVNKAYNIWQWISVTIPKELKAAKDTLVKVFDFGLGGLVKAIRGFFEGIFDRLWDWIKNVFSKVVDFFHGLWDWILGAVKGLANWVKEFFKTIWENTIRPSLKLLLPSAPGEGENLIAKGFAYIGITAGILSLFTAAAGLMHRWAGTDLRYAAAMLGDITGYREILGAIIGIAITLGYRQPITYYYRKLFRPYLPGWSDLVSMYDRSILTDEKFKDVMGWYGIPEEWWPQYYQLSDRPIPVFQVGDMAAWDLFSKGEMLEEMRFFGFWEEGAKRMMPFLWWRAKMPWLTRLVTEMMFALRRGFCKVEDIMEGFGKLRAGTDDIVSSGHRKIFPVTWKMQHLPTDEEIIDMIGDWSRRRLICDAHTDATLVDYREDLITEEECKKRLKKYIIYDEVIEGEMAPIKARKMKRIEPEKGKELRRELKAVLTKCFKEGFITHDRLQTEIETSNQTVDEPTLIKIRASWEAFYDDTSDLFETYKYNLDNGLITKEEFKSELIAKGFRPDKVNRYLERAEAKIKAAIMKKREKIEVKLDKAIDKKADLEAELSEIEEKLPIEAEPREIARLKKKIAELTIKIKKVDREILDFSTQLEYLPTLYI